MQKNGHKSTVEEVKRKDMVRAVHDLEVGRYRHDWRGIKEAAGYYGLDPRLLEHNYHEGVSSAEDVVL